MDRKEMTDRLVNMGFYASHRGFTYILDALETLKKEGEDMKFTSIYHALAKRHETNPSSVERCMRHTITQYYQNCNVHPELVSNSQKGRFTNCEFVHRLFRIIEEEELTTEYTEAAINKYLFRAYNVVTDDVLKWRIDRAMRAFNMNDVFEKPATR